MKNYINLINHFWRENEKERISRNALTLYFALLHKCNGLSWKDDFFWIVKEVQEITGLTPNAQLIAKKELARRGLITFRKGNRNHTAPQYTILEPYTLPQEQEVEIIDTSTETPRAFERTANFDPLGDTQKMGSICKNLTISASEYQEFANEILRDWEITNEKKRDWKHFLHTMRKKVFAKRNTPKRKKTTAELRAEREQEMRQNLIDYQNGTY